MVRNAKLNFDELNTILSEIQSMMNARPLTYLSEDTMEAITPYHLLHGWNTASKLGNNLLRQEDTTEVDILTKREKYVCLLLEKFWSRFYHEYTVALRERILYDQIK